MDRFATPSERRQHAFRATLIVMRTLRQSAGYVLARPAGHSTTPCVEDSELARENLHAAAPQA
jgi:hypothetical protein